MPGVSENKKARRKSAHERKARARHLQEVAETYTKERSQVFGPLRDRELDRLTQLAHVAETRTAEEDAMLLLNFIEPFITDVEPAITDAEPLPAYSTVRPAVTYGVRRKNHPRILIEELYMVLSMFVDPRLSSVLFGGLLSPSTHPACNCRSYFPDDKLPAFFAHFGETRSRFNCSTCGWLTTRPPAGNASHHILIRDLLASDKSLDFSASGVEEMFTASAGRNVAITEFVKEAMVIFPPTSFWQLVVQNLKSQKHSCIVAERDKHDVAEDPTSQSNIRLLRTLSPLYRLWEAAHNTALPPRNWRGASSSLVRALRGFAVRIPCSFNACLNYFKLDWWCRPPPGKSRARYGRIAEIMAASLYETPEIDHSFWEVDSTCCDDHEDDCLSRVFFHRGDTLKRRFSFYEVENYWADTTDVYALSRVERVLTMVDHFQKWSMGKTWVSNRRPGPDYAYL
jgi:hypothetical protein